MKKISSAELARFVLKHRWPMSDRDVPRLPVQLPAAIRLRDDPGAKGVIRETGRGYCLMGWNRD